VSERRIRVPLHFGPGLDRATGTMAVEPGAMEDLRNFYLLDEKLQARKGFAPTLQLTAPGVPLVTHVLAGHPLRSEGVAIVVGWAEPAGEVHVFRVSADMTSVDHIGHWFDYELQEFAPIIHMCEVFGRVFMAHDEPRATQRAPTMVYDPVTPQDGLFSELTDDFSPDGPHPMKFRGVVAHLDYLVGWGYGTAQLDRPELVRISLPGQPRTFDELHYFIAGDRRDPVLQCVPGASSLIVFKAGEWHELFGSHRGNFGISRRDPLYGLLAPRLAVNVSGAVFFWDATGPRVTDGSSPSQSLEIPLDLQGFEAADLPEETHPCESFATYVWQDRIVLFVFGRRAYACTIRVPGDWKWSYWTFPWRPLCAFTTWDTTFTQRDAPIGYPTWEDAEAGGTFARITVGNVDQEGDERLELWLHDTSTNDPYFLAASRDVLLTEEQILEVGGLQPGVTYAGALRYRRGNRVAEGYNDDPSTWPEVSQGEFTTALDPPEVGELVPDFGTRFAATGNTEWVWERTASDAHYLQFQIKPAEATFSSGEKIKIYRSADGGSPAEIAELEEGVDFNGSEAFLWKDEDPPQGAVLFYWASTAVGATESPLSDPLRLWPGPMPEAFKGPVPNTQTIAFSSDRTHYDHRVSVYRLAEVFSELDSRVRYFDNWNTAVPEYNAEPDQDRGTEDYTHPATAEPIDQQPPSFGLISGLLVRKGVSLAEPLPAGSQVVIAAQYEVSQFGVWDASPLFERAVIVTTSPGGENGGEGGGDL
jgi:hypothetical protein